MFFFFFLLCQAKYGVDGIITQACAHHIPAEHVITLGLDSSPLTRGTNVCRPSHLTRDTEPPTRPLPFHWTRPGLSRPVCPLSPTQPVLECAFYAEPCPFYYVCLGLGVRQPPVWNVPLVSFLPPSVGSLLVSRGRCIGWLNSVQASKTESQWETKREGVKV